MGIVKIILQKRKFGWLQTGKSGGNLKILFFCEFNDSQQKESKNGWIVFGRLAGRFHYRWLIRFAGKLNKPKKK